MRPSTRPASRRLRSPALVGRVDEVAQLDELVARAAAGTGNLVVVRGEPGVGKTRLLAECVERAAEAGAATLAGRAVAGGGPFRPLSDALLARMRDAWLPEPGDVGPFAGPLGRLIPGWADDHGNELLPDLPLLISEGLLRVLRQLGAPGGVVLSLDDLQWADIDTLTVLDRLADAVRDSPVLIIAAARDEPVPALDRLGTGQSRRVLHLRRLAPDDVSALVQACSAGAPLPDAVRTYITEHADGLPFFVEELLAALVGSGALVRTAAGWEMTRELPGAVPASFAAVVRERMDELDPVAVSVVEAAAVIGREVDWRLLPTITGHPEAVVLEALRIAVERQLVVYDGGSVEVFRFVHSLTREAVLERVLPPQRVAVARAAAAVLEDVGRDRALAAELHLVAGDTGRAAAALLDAARGAGSAVGTREHLLRRSWELDPADDTALALAEVLVAVGRAAEACDVGGELLERLDATDPRRRTVALTLARGRVLSSHWAEAERHLAEAGRGADVDALAAHVAFGQHRRADAERIGLAAVRSGADVPAARCEALEVVGRCQLYRDDDEHAAMSFQRALDIARSHGLLSWEVRAMTELARVQSMSPAKVAQFERARELAVVGGLLSTAAQIDLELLKCNGMLVEHGSTPEVAGRCEELALSLRLPVLAGGARLFRALADGHAGRFDEMDGHLEQAHRLLAGTREFAAFATFVAGVPAMTSHDLDAWRLNLEDGMRIVRLNPAESPSPFSGQHCLVETVVGDGRAAREELRTSGWTTHWTNRAALAYADAVAAGREGRSPAVHLAEAEAVMAPFEWRRHHARLLIAPAALHAGWGQPIEWLRAAAGHFSAVGATALAKASRDALRAAGAPVPRQGRGDSVVPAPLRALGVTSREIDVLALVAEGLSNAAIADRLVLSPRTVETHVGNLLAKTGAADRGALAGLASVLR